MISLPNGNKCSEPAVSPKNYTSQKKIRSDWFIFYRFYCSAFPKGKLIKIKNINVYKDVIDRKDAAKKALLNINAELRSGYNPITKEQVLPPDYEVHPLTPLSLALTKGAEKCRGEHHTREVLINGVKFIIKICEMLGIHMMPVCEVKKRHIRQVLDKAAEVRSFSAGNYNHHRSYLMSVFRELSELDAIETNPVLEIRKQKEVTKIKELLTREQRAEVNEYLHKNYYTFWRYLHIFFHSGARSTELFKLKCKHVNIIDQTFKLTVIKERKPREVNKIMKDVVVDLWREVIKDGKPDDYVFAKGLKPGPVKISSRQISERWLKHVKAPRPEPALPGKRQKKGGLGITADWYKLKHLASDETSRILSIEHAMLQNSHKSVRTTGIYAVNELERQAERVRKLGNTF